MIDGFMKIFKLLEVKRRMDDYLRQNPDAENYEKEAKKGQVLIKRLSVATVLLIKENPVLPISFKFEGTCLLE